MQLSVESVIGVLERTPSLLRGLLKDLPEELERGDEGEDTWSPFDIVGHLVHGERTDWIPLHMQPSASVVVTAGDGPVGA